MKLKKFPGIHISTPEEHRGSCHNSRGAPFFPPHFEMGVPFSVSSRKESWCSCHKSKGGALNLKVERNSKGRATIPKVPMSQSTPDIPDSPALTRLSPQVSTQNMMAGVTALWHLKRKPQIPMTNRQHSLCCLFWDPTPTSNRKLKGRLEGHLLLFKRGHNFLVLFFHLRFWFKCPISAFLGGFAYNGSLHSSPLLPYACVIFPLL